MNSQVAVSLVQDALWQTVLISAPLLLLTLTAGLLISIFQAVTQIQEMTLSFIPKILAVVVALLLFGHWMLRMLTNYTTGIFVRLPEIIR